LNWSKFIKNFINMYWIPAEIICPTRICIQGLGGQLTGKTHA
jgi:hypothetical protein